MTKFAPEKPCDSLPRLPPKADLETRPILKACIEARAALAELKQAGDLLPNQTILINTIPLLEARASSESENVVTTTDRLFRFAQEEADGQADPATKEALRYRTALYRGYESLKAPTDDDCDGGGGVSHHQGCTARYPSSPRNGVGQ